MASKTSLFVILVFSYVYNGDCELCSNIPPGLEKLSRGVDITRLNLLPLDNQDDAGFSRKVINFSCNKKAKWTSPYAKQITYDLPDQIETINSIPGGVLDASFSLHSSLGDIKKSMSVKAGISLLKGMFSGSGNFKRFQHTIANNSKKVAEVEASFSSIEVDYLPFWELSLRTSALKYVENLLPNNYNENPSKFENFFKYFGTHYFSRARFGGVFRIAIEMENSLLQTMSNRDIEANAKASFFGILKIRGGYFGSITRVDQEYSSKSQTTVTYYGGSTNLLNVDTWSDWWSSVPGNPWLFSGKLEPIVALVPEGPKKQALITAYNVYLDKAYLSEVRRTLYAFIGKGNVGEEKAVAFLNELNKLISQTIPDNAAVLKLGNQITDFVVAPEWFTSNTQLCYKWYPEADGGQCGGNAPSRTLCAKPNSQTAWYRDDTDSRGGGCRMMWSIMSPISEQWFKNVQICFRWHPDGDAGQCGGGAPQETCAAVGSYTHVYRDNTHHPPGGCQMSWRITVPNDAPGWMLNTKLCYYWYPDGDGGQCGGGADRSLCAVANQWTNYYRDDTDGRPGGCQMSWSLVSNSS